jgi:ADP-ribosylglycohydrolase
MASAAENLRASRLRGSLLGLAWGDALGCPVEFWDTAEVRQVYGHYADLPMAIPFARLPAREEIWAHLRPLGLHSDDTQQALALIQTCLASAGWQMDAWAELLVRGDSQCAWRGTGRFFRQAVAALKAGALPLQSGSPSGGVGAAMRIAPLGALYCTQPDELARVVLESSLVTHADARAVASAYAIAVAVARLVAGESATALRASLPGRVRDFEVHHLAPRFADPAEHLAFSTALGVALDPAHATLASSRAALCAHAQRAMQSHMQSDMQHSPLGPNHPFALVGCVHALSAALWSGEPWLNNSPAEILAGVIRQGGDTDTIGAITGALLGARFGADWVPVARLRDHTALQRYAQALVDHHLPETVADLLAREAAYSREELQFSRECLARFQAGQQQQ